MKKPSNISHPLKNRTGTSQRTRVIGALQADIAPIDGKTLADRLNIISKYALQINFYEYAKNDREGEYQELDNWSGFFKNSLPFQLAVLSKISIDDLDKQFILLYNEAKQNPSKQSLESLLHFVLNKIIVPITTLFKVVEAAQNSFTTPLLGILKSSFIEPLKSFISIYNASVTFLCVCKESFMEYMAPPWQLKVDEIYAFNICIKKVKKGHKEAFLKAAEQLNTIFYQFLGGFRDIVETAPDFIEESLRPLEESLQKKHQPHLALLFTFLELFNHLQGNINELSTKHLDFFYERVLKIIPKAAVPDKAHIVFEIAKHLNEYPLQEGLLLKNGKDSNNQDIQFGLDQEIIIDKAQIKDVRTVALHTVRDHSTSYIEGVYTAPVANSSDGLGKAFEKEQPVNWATLGSKFSKYKEEGNDEAQPHPKARLGFVLASPVLLLQEGERTVNILLKCKADYNFIEEVSGIYDIKTAYTVTDTIFNSFENLLPEGFAQVALAQKSFKNLIEKKKNDVIFKEDLDAFLVTTNPEDNTEIFSQALQNDIQALFNPLESEVRVLNTPLFTFRFSGEKEWLAPTPENVTVFIASVSNIFDFKIQIDFELDFPAVTFFSEENLEEKIDVQESLPVVKIELNEFSYIKKDPTSFPPDPCDLKKQPKSDSETIKFSPYHFFRQFGLLDARINVNVCGMKDLIVQNDEGALDINSQIFPFGLRPNVPAFDPMNQAVLNPDPNSPPVNEEVALLGQSFYIGSKEILFKKWNAVRVNMEWKDKPTSFHDYYKAYLKTVPDPDPEPEEQNFGLDEEKFQVKIDQLNDGSWFDIEKQELFKTTADDFESLICDTTFYGWEVKNNNLNRRFVDYDQPIDFFKNSQNGFLRFTLADQDFLHREYPFVLARQMLAYAYSSQNVKLTDAIYINGTNKTVITARLDFFNDSGGVNNSLDAAKGSADSAKQGVEDLITFINDDKPAALATIQTIRDRIADVKQYIQGDLASFQGDLEGVTDLDQIGGLVTDFLIKKNAVEEFNDDSDEAAVTATDAIDAFITDILGQVNGTDGIEDQVENVITALDQLDVALGDTNILEFLQNEAYQALIPNEPWTPTIKNLFVDYSATAEKEDMHIIHLHPFENTSKLEDINDTPTLFPFIDKEGTLFIGIENLIPGGNLSILFQLAEATANSEMDRAEIDWHYLKNNNWEILKPDFDIISDETDGLTVSGIVTIAVPADMNRIGNTLMPDGLYWIRLTTPVNAMAVAETIGIHTQAANASARLGELNDTSRLEGALAEGSISKLVEGDFSIKKVTQLYPSFGGRRPEAEGHFYVRVSEHLKHKGRALMINDYEKIVLEGFPEIYKAKCISHTMGLSAIEYQRDLEIAPGYVIVTVIPDLTKLMAGNQLEPKAPVSLLEKIADHLRKKNSPFARIKVMNPRYEYIDVTISVRLYRGKSENFYKQKLKEDLTNLLAPWFLGGSEKIAFGQSLLFSDVVGFVEKLDYVDFIVNLELNGEGAQKGAVIKPLTARSILTAGKISVTIDEEKCLDQTGSDNPSYQTLSSTLNDQN